MAEQIKELLEKIQKEGVEAAEEKARQIESQARQKAEDIVAQAHARSAKLLEDAQDRIRRSEESSQAALRQASRDMILSLKGQIAALLERIVAGEIAQALSGGELAGILSSLIKEACAHEAQDILILVNEKDKQQLQAHFVDKLKQETRKGIEIRASDSIRSGFSISFDAGKSQFDFTDTALAEYISRIVKPKLAELLTPAQS